MPDMNKYDLMNDVIPPLDESQMAMRGYAKGGGVGNFICFLLEPFDTSQMDEWLKGDPPAQEDEQHRDHQNQPGGTVFEQQIDAVVNRIRDIVILLEFQVGR